MAAIENKLVIRRSTLIDIFVSIFQSNSESKNEILHQKGSTKSRTRHTDWTRSKFIDNYDEPEANAVFRCTN